MELNLIITWVKAKKEQINLAKLMDLNSIYIPRKENIQKNTHPKIAIK